MPSSFGASAPSESSRIRSKPLLLNLLLLTCFYESLSVFEGLYWHAKQELPHLVLRSYKTQEVMQDLVDIIDSGPIKQS